MKRAPVQDRFFAKGIEYLSVLCCRYPNTVGTRVVGEHPTYWWLAKESFSDVYLADENRGWHTIDGDPEAGRLPSGYTRAAVLRTERDGMRRWANATASVPVAA